MLGALAACAQCCPGGVGLSDFPDTWEYDQEKQQFYYTSPTTRVKVYLPRGAAPSSTPADFAGGGRAPSASTAPTTISEDIGNALKTAFAVPGQVVGAVTPIMSDVAKDPILGPLAALGLQRALPGARPTPTPQPAPAPWSTGEKLALAGGLTLGAIGLGYGLSRRSRRGRR